MKNEPSKLGELFKKAFDDFKPEPSAGLWDKIARRPEMLQPVSPSSGLSWWKWFLGGAGITAVIIAVVIILRTNDRDAVTVPSITAPVASQPLKTGTNSDLSTKAGPASPSENVQSRVQAVNGSKKKIHSKPLSVTAVSPAIPMSQSSTDLGSNAGNNNLQQHGNSIPAYTPPALSQATTHNSTGPKLSEPSSSENNGLTNPNPKESIEVIESQPWCKDESLTLWAKGGTTYQWSTGETTETVTVTPSSTSIYSVTVTDHSGQHFPYTITISVLECKDVNIPTAFTPNDDGLNDIYRVTLKNGAEISNFTLRIFNRTSQLLFETKDINQGWDGKIKGKVAEMGVYVYQVSYTDAKGKDHKFTGPLTLLGKE